MRFPYRRLALRSLLSGKDYFSSERIRLNRFVFRIACAIFIFGLVLFIFSIIKIFGFVMVIGSLEAMALCYLNCRDEVYALASGKGYKAETVTCSPLPTLNQLA